jgi:DNA polymerase delta subunit 4
MAPKKATTPAKASTSQAHRTRGVAKPQNKNHQRRLDFDKPGVLPKPPSTSSELAAASAREDREEAVAVAEAPPAEAALPGLTEAEEKELCRFDLTFKYGPCVGLSRAERWVRAQALGLEPPPRVYELLDRVPADSKSAQSLLSAYAL